MQVKERTISLSEVIGLSSLERLNRILDAVKMVLYLDEDAFIEWPGGVYWEPNNLTGQLIDVIAEGDNAEYAQKMFVDRLKSDSLFPRQFAERIKRYQRFGFLGE